MAIMKIAGRELLSLAAAAVLAVLVFTASQR
jgi:hypothetical protein